MFSAGDKFKSHQGKYNNIRVCPKNNKEQSSHEYDDEVFENVDEEVVEDLEDEDVKNKDKKVLYYSFIRV